MVRATQWFYFNAMLATKKSRKMNKLPDKEWT